MSNKKENHREDPFRFLKAKDNSKEANDIVRNWYIARAYVINMLHLEEYVFTPKDEGHLHVIVENDSPRMLFVARQIALMAHFLNFVEDCPDESERHRTVITIVSQDKGIKGKLEQEDYLCNLPKYCKFVDRDAVPENKDSFVDIEIHISDNVPENKDSQERILSIKESDVDNFFEQYEHADDQESIFLIDTRAAFYSGKVYDIGTAYSNIPAEDIHCTKRYSLALSIFEHDILKMHFKQQFDDEEFEKARSGQLGLATIKMNVSNILCADCFKIREKSIEKTCKESKVTQRTWEENNEALSKSEHTRWVVEKLILGYRPLSSEEHYHLDCLHVEFHNAEKKKRYLDKLKNNEIDAAHVDLCSYANLRRIKPEDLKYDSFLMLAIPKIMKKVGKDD